MPCAGPICSARSSLVLMGLPTTRSSMFMLSDPLDELWRMRLRTQFCMADNGKFDATLTCWNSLG